MLDSERTFKIKVRSRWTVFEISLTSTVICILKSFACKRDSPTSSKLQTLQS